MFPIMRLKSAVKSVGPIASNVGKRAITLQFQTSLSSGFISAKQYSSSSSALSSTPDKPVDRLEGFITEEGGLQYRDTKVGAGAAVHKGDTVFTVWAKYPHDAFATGRDELFRSFEKKYHELGFIVGQRMVGTLEDGFLAGDGMRVGGKRDVIIPRGFNGDFQGTCYRLECISILPKGTRWEGQPNDIATW